MLRNGKYWYDQQSAAGRTTDPSDNADMISPAFWSVKASDFKITRSDDSRHTALLRTTGGCLSAQTFRAKVVGYGNYRNGQVWASDNCRGVCSSVQYGGRYISTEGFGRASCGYSAGRVGFWCEYDHGYHSAGGAVLMIGNGGSSCGYGDHGIAITDSSAAKFGSGRDEYDFGDDANSAPTRAYSLNLWVKWTRGGLGSPCRWQLTKLNIKCFQLCLLDSL